MLLAVTGDADHNALQTEYYEEARNMNNSTNEFGLEQYDTTSTGPTSSIADRLPELPAEAKSEASEGLRREGKRKPHPRLGGHRPM